MTHFSSRSKTLRFVAWTTAAALALHSPSQAVTYWDANFQHWSVTGGSTIAYTESMVPSDFDAGRLDRIIGLKEGRTQIERYANGSQVMKVKYPGGNHTYDTSGAQFRMLLPGGSWGAGRDDYSLEYRVKFGNNFEWVKGGKLPGLAGGSCPVGGYYDGYNGFSSRYMWRPNGKLVLYFYWSGQISRSYPSGQQYGQDVDLDTTMQAGKSYRLRQRVKLNTPGQSNGVMQVWVQVDNGAWEEKMNWTTIRYRNDTSWNVNYFYFSTFYGGHTSDWAPTRDNYAIFDDFRLFN